MMFPLIPKIKKDLQLGIIEKIDEKLLAVYNYTKINKIFCTVNNPYDYRSPQPVRSLYVADIAIPPGSSSSVKFKLKECFRFLTEATNEYVRSDASYDEITKTLRRCIKRSQKAMDENNIYDDFGIDHHITYRFWFKKKWIKVYGEHLDLSGQTQILVENYNLRYNFFIKLHEMFSEVLTNHLIIPPSSKRPFTLDSKNAELEISELVYILYRTSHKLKIDEKAGGTFPKFKKAFFGLFGLSEQNYNKKVIQILERKQNHFIEELSANFMESHAKQWRSRAKKRAKRMNKRR